MDSNKIALVTGASRGIGRAIALRLTTMGIKVAAAARNADHLADLAQEAGEAMLFPVPLDVTDPTAIQAAIARIGARWGHVDIVINAAGISGRRPIDEPEADIHWDQIMAANLSGTFHVIRAALPLLKDGGRIINLSSVLGKFGVPGYAAYCASKHGVIGLTRALALELAPRRITVNALCPGWVETDMAVAGIREIAESINLPEAEVRYAEEQAIPLGRFLDPEEVAGLAAYLVSEEARGLTGQAINLCGGTVMH